MTSSTTTSPPISRRADLVGRSLMGFNVLLTLVAFVNGIALTVSAAADDVVVQAWQMFGFAIFAGMWTLVALWPRRIPGIWEFLIAHKLAITIFCLVNISQPDAVLTGAIDGFIMITTVIAYLLCRGWRSWNGFVPRRALAA
ncbi:hypothetical protein E3O25_10975 [Cryobacterium sp. TMT1-3]|uniref:Uncharacterized protein n=1 Tax=Cryobacterium luteum TaxID=1424661 RepID=A0A1H8F5S7_9MICO|nr:MULTISPECIES: hypothetical protein [Cryobacterium]TFB85505.1 hypothetical protein E3O10_15350 [Cryobacterium luteum]TFC26590.1 hypothetical protein E3O25_10975 [Cryobacterium sp. TMT1-3]SEN26497.1 hypothetical protein SAMN05216281_105181 [Cryobacterium luteum]